MLVFHANPPGLKPRRIVSIQDIMKRNLLNQFSVVVFLLIIPVSGNTQSLYFPPSSGSTWDTLSPLTLGWCQPELDTLIDYLEARDTKAFLVLKDGKLVVEKYYGTFTRDSAWYWASAGKSLTAFLVGIAQQEGYLSISDTTSRIIGPGWTACTTAQEEDITVRDQLCMTSGLDDGVPDKDCTDPACLQYLANAGTRWAYHNAPYTLLDTVLEAATGQSLNNYLQQKVKAPTGMTGLFFKLGYNNVFFSTARSMARYGLLILNHGNWNGNQVMTDTAYFNQMVNTSQSLNLSYGYLWWLNGKPSYMLPGPQFVFPGSISPNAPSDMFAALGRNGQILNIVPSQNLVWLRLGNEPNAGFVPNFFNDTIWQKLNAAMCQTTGWTEQQEWLEFSVFPNPVHSGGDMVIRSRWNATCFLLDITGRVIRKVNLRSGENTISMKGLNPGLYVLKAESGGQVYCMRLVVQ